MPTRRYSTLSGRIGALEKRLLPTPSPTGSYSPKQYDLVRAFVVLAHAEVEYFLEDLANHVLDKVKSRWDATKSAGRCLSALMMYNDKRLSLPSNLGRQNTADTFDEVAKAAIKKHRDYVIQQNHGVKEANILRLYLPMGVLETDLDPVWLAAMNTFGTQRGVVAHTSARRLSSPIDPVAASQMVANVLSGLQQVEPTVLELRRK